MRRPLCHTAVFALGLVLLAPAARLSAITFDISYDEREKPYWDPTGQRLRTIIDAAASTWSNLIQSDEEFDFEFSWADIGGTKLGVQEHYDFGLFEVDNIILDTRDQAGIPRPWFIDSTPLVNEEYSMHQTLVRDLSNVDVDNGFDGSPPDLLEVGYSGVAIDSHSNAGGYDLYTAVLHEMGHLIGYNFAADGEYDINPSTLGGIELAINEGSSYHPALVGALMQDVMGMGERRLPSATDVLGTWDDQSLGSFNLARVDFLGGPSNRWGDGGNWIGGQVPDSDNEVFIRHGGNVFDLTDNVSAKSLAVDADSALYVQGNRLRVFGDTLMGVLEPGGGQIHIGDLTTDVAELETENLQLNAGLINIVSSAGILDVNKNLMMSPQTMLMGAGRVEVGGTLTNNGTISGGTFLLFGFGGQLTLKTTGSGKLDLDGDSLEFGTISATSGNLRVEGPMADRFNGRAVIDATRTMSIQLPWNMDGTLTMRGGADAAHAATMAGGQMTLGGQVTVDGHAVVTAPVLINSPAIVSLPDANDVLTLAGASTIRGGSFAGNGTLAVQGPLSVVIPDALGPVNPPVSQQISAAAFTAGPVVTNANPGVLSPVTPTVRNNFTTYALNVPLEVRTGGTVTASASSLQLAKQTTMAGGRITGTNSVNQIGDLLVTMSSVIDPTNYVWGAGNANHRTTILAKKRLDLTPGTISRGASANEYGGHIVIGAMATLNVDVTSATSWKMAGTMELGSESTVRGDNIVNTGVISGWGSLLVANLQNLGTMAPGSPLGQLQVPTGAYVQGSTGKLEIQLGGTVQGSTYDVLRASTAQLGGKLSISLINGFLPAVGSVFDVVTASSITGVFSELEVVSNHGATLAGKLVYSSNRVSFQVTKMQSNPFGARAVIGAVPEPATCVMGLVGLMGCAVRRRRG